MWLPAVWYAGLSRNSVVLTVVMGQDPPVQKLEEKGLQTFFLQEMKEEQEGHFFRILTMGMRGLQCPGAHRRPGVVLGTPLLKGIGARRPDS